MSYKKINLHIIWFLKKSTLSMAAVKNLFIYILRGILFSHGVLVFLWPKQGCLWLYHTVPFGAAGNAIPSRPSTKGLGLCYGSAAARSVAKIPYKTQDPYVSLWVSGAAVPAQLLKFQFRHWNPNTSIPETGKYLMEWLPPCRLVFVVLFRP